MIKQIIMTIDIMILKTKKRVKTQVFTLLFKSFTRLSRILRQMYIDQSCHRDW